MDGRQSTPTAEWRQLPDGSWEPTRRSSSPAATVTESGNPGGGSEFLVPSEVLGGDNILVTELPDGKVLIERGGHAVLYESLEVPFRPGLDFRGPGVEVTDDPGGGRTVVFVDKAQRDGEMVWRGLYDGGAIYRPGDVVAFEDASFVFVGSATGYGYGYGPYGSGAYGSSSAPSGGYGAESYGAGPYGG